MISKFLPLTNFVAQAELNGVGERVHHVAAVVVQNQNVGIGLQNRRDVGREVGLPSSGVLTGLDGFPAQRLGRLFDGLFGGVTPVVVGGQVIGLAVVP
jgi:hypothetical protein